MKNPGMVPGFLLPVGLRGLPKGLGAGLIEGASLLLFDALHEYFICLLSMAFARPRYTPRITRAASERLENI